MKYFFLVEIECENDEQANEVIQGRMGYDEDYGYEYGIIGWELCGREP